MMIDTICLLIPGQNVLYLSGISNWELYSRTSQYDKFVRNPTKAEKMTGKYFPRITGYSRNKFKGSQNIRIEFSVPKLLYLNNLDELEDKDFEEVIEVLQDRLKTMGIKVFKSILMGASVSSVHYSKNILLQDGYTSNYVISEINKVNLRKSFDFSKTRFMNDGQSLYAHATSHEFVIYDKVADLNKDKKRAIDKDQTTKQRSIFEILNKSEFKEIIRFEIRLNHKQKLNKILQDLGYEKNLTFKDIFSSEISKKVVTSYWEKLVKEKSFGIFSISMSIKDMLQKLFSEDKKLKPKQAIYLLGLFMLAKDENGMRQLRTIISKNSHDRTWYRITKDMQKSNELITKNKFRNWVTQIDKALEIYKPYKINYETKY